MSEKAASRRSPSTSRCCSDRFSYSVTLAGDTLAMGARGEDGTGTGVNPANNDSAFNSGAAYVFQ